MRFQMEKEGTHSISLLSNLILFFVFTFIGVCVVTVGAKVYQSVTSHMEENYEARTALAYTAEKIRQADVSTAVTISTVEDIPALCLKQTNEDAAYETYIYYYNGALREAFVKEGAAVTLLQGTSIVELPSFIIEETAHNMYRFTATQDSGEEISLLIRPKSQ